MSGHDDTLKVVRPRTALLLPGGGARGAYQVGVIKGLASIHGTRDGNPYPILCGTSAGAINAVALASRIDNFMTAAQWLETLWMSLDTHQVYRSDFGGVIRNAWRLFRSLVNTGMVSRRPVALLDNSPLRQLLTNNIDFDAIAQHIANEQLKAVCVTAMNYTEGMSSTFFQGGGDSRGWQRWRRVGVPTPLQVQHVMASTAIPTIFPAQRIGRNYYGDGALRQLTPISPALNLGAERVLIIPASGHHRQYSKHVQRAQSPAFGHIIGHLLNSAFVDSIESDIERLQRINELIKMMPNPESGVEIDKTLRRIEYLVISPSEDIDALAEEHVHELPRSLRLFLRRTGSNRYQGGVNVASYLLFTQGFCRELIDLGYRDAMANEEKIREFAYMEPVSKGGWRALNPFQR